MLWIMRTWGKTHIATIKWNKLKDSSKCNSQTFSHKKDGFLPVFFFGEWNPRGCSLPALPAACTGDPFTSLVLSSHSDLPDFYSFSLFFPISAFIPTHLVMSCSFISHFLSGCRFKTETCICDPTFSFLLADLNSACDAHFDLISISVALFPTYLPPSGRISPPRWSEVKVSLTSDHQDLVSKCQLIFVPNVMKAPRGVTAT